MSNKKIHVNIILTLSVPQNKKLENHNSAKSINLDIIRKLIKYSSKNILRKTMFTLIVIEILLFESRLV